MDTLLRPATCFRDLRESPLLRLRAIRLEPRMEMTGGKMNYGNIKSETKIIGVLAWAMFGLTGCAMETSDQGSEFDSKNQGECPVAC